MKHVMTVTLAAVVCAAFCAGCSTYRVNTTRNEIMRERTQAAIAKFKKRDPSLERFFENSYGYAIFPKIGKGGIGIGGAHGDGEVYEQGEFIGWATMTQGSIGFQLGGQVFMELIFFEDEPALDVFKQGATEFSANASAVAVETGAGSAVDYESGVAVFTLPTAGLMFEAAIGGQRFEFIPFLEEGDEQGN